MVQKSRGMRQGTRRKLAQRPGYKPPITKFLRKFNEGQKVIIMQEASSQKGMPFPRYKGVVGTISEKRGRSYVVEIRDGGKLKKLISRPEHLKAA